MTDVSVPYKFPDGYISDLGENVGFNLSFKKPSDINDNVAKDIIKCVGELRESERVACSQAGLITPRKLTFIRENGNSFSLVFPDKNEMVKQAQCVVDIIKKTDFLVVCVKLVGEKYVDLIESGLLDLGDRQGDSVTKKPIKPEEKQGKYKLVYSGVMKEYESDSIKSGDGVGGTIFQPFSSQTDTPSEPYSELKDAIEGCHGDLTTIRTCGAKKSKREARKYIPHVAVEISNNNNDLNPLDNTAVEVLQTLSIYAASSDPQKLLDCANEIAKFKPVVCLPYYGESYGLFHKVLDLTK